MSVLTFGAWVTGRVCNPQTLRPIRPDQRVTGRVTGIYDTRPGCVEVRDDNGNLWIVQVGR